MRAPRMLRLSAAPILIAGLAAVALGMQRPAPIEDVPINPLCANFFLQQEVEPWKRELTLQMAADAGIGWARQQFAWEEAEPRPGAYNWTKFDELVGLYERYHMQVIARLDRPPNWTKKDPRFKQGPPDNLADYGDYVSAFVTRYGARVHYIQIWNEPNLLSEWGGRAPDAAAYAALLHAAYTRAKQANPSVRVLSAPLAPTLEQSSVAISELSYLTQLYQLGAQHDFDILSANAFGQDLSADDPPSPNVLNFSRVVLQHDLMLANHDDHKAVWISEYGWNASPDTFKKGSDALIWQKVSAAQQAEYTVRGIQKARAEWPWAGPLCIWYFRQVGNIPAARSDYYFAMVAPDFTPSPLYRAVKILAGK